MMSKTKLDDVIKYLKDDGNTDHKLYVIAEMFYAAVKQLTRIANSLENLTGGNNRKSELPTCSTCNRGQSGEEVLVDLTEDSLKCAICDDVDSQWTPKLDKPES